jgi:hypothetical protein
MSRVSEAGVLCQIPGTKQPGQTAHYINCFSGRGMGGGGEGGAPLSCLAVPSRGFVCHRLLCICHCKYIIEGHSLPKQMKH